MIKNFFLKIYSKIRDKESEKVLALKIKG